MARSRTRRDDAAITVPRRESALEFEQHLLANGLRVIVHHDPAVPLVTLNTLVHVGSRNEEPGRTGFAHLFEHLMFEGSPNLPRGAYDRWCTLVGGDNNAWTTSDCTDYHITLPAHHLPSGLWLESDRMLGLVVDEESLETQRRVVLEERRQTVEETPYGDLVEQMRRIAYPSGHPYGWEPIGRAEDIAAATLEEVCGFYERWYRPDNATLVVAGSCPTPYVLEQVERWYGSIPARRAIVPSLSPALAPIAGAREQIVTDVPHAMAVLAWHVPSVLDPAWPVFDLLVALLSDGDSSPLYSTLVYDREIAGEVECYIDEGELGSMLYITATAVDVGTEPEVLEEGVREVIAEIVREGIESREITRAKRQRMTQIAYAMQSISYRAERLAWYATFAGDPSLAASEADRCAAVEEVSLAAAVALLDTVAPNVLLYRPIEPISR